jgi:hypothetical protein
MSIQKNWKIYYTTTEVKAKLKESVRIKATEIVKEIKSEIVNKETSHV